jgi:hypothetical protein
VSDASKTAWLSIEGARAVQDAEHGECEKSPSCHARVPGLQSREGSSKPNKNCDANDPDLEEEGRG